MIHLLRTLAAVAAGLVAGCSTVQARLDDPPIFSRTTPTTVGSFQSCFVAATANLNVNYLPRGNGGTFTSTAGPQNYVLWLVNIDDLGAERRVSVHAVDSIWGKDKRLPAIVESCID